ncbi:MAG: EAL domain-containing protein [Rhodocyclaceae bacterium]|nr:EAL domain-containing protein [Rhodocyclaceae bacterium]
MSIKRGFRFNLVLGGLLIAAAIISFAYTQVQISAAVAQKEVLDRIGNEGMELVQVTNEVLLYSETRAMEQWREQYQETAGRVAGAMTNPVVPPGRGRELLGQISMLLTDMPPLFDALRAAHETPKAGANIDVKGLLASQMFRKTILLQSALRNLVGFSEVDMKERYAESKERMLLTFGAFVGTIFIFGVIVSWQFRKTILLPIDGLADVIRRIKAGDGAQRAEVHAEDEIGVVCGAFNRLLDQQEADRDEIEAAADRFRATFDQAAVGIVHVALDGRWMRINGKFRDIVGYGADELTEGALRDITHPEDRDIDQELQHRLLGGRIGTYSVEKRLQRKDGSLVWVNLTVSLVRDTRGEPEYFIKVFEDISARKAAEQEIEFLAYHDVLTSLPNRMLVKDRLDQAAAYADRSGAKVALLYLDLDNFKTINDSLGHPVGDALLKAVAQRLLSCVRDTDTVSRQGGDEFLIVLSGVVDADGITAVADKLLEKLADSFSIEGHDLSTSVSVGIAMYPDDAREFDVLLKKADTALYRAKEAGRNTYRFFTEQMNVEASEYLRIRNGLRRALDNQEFVLHYQPQIELASGRVVGVEALVRWQHPELGLVPPGRFIPVAEDSGLIVEIGAWVIAEACRQGQFWRRNITEDMVVAVNLSAVQFKRGNLERTVLEALRDTNLTPEGLELELTESILIQDTESVLATVRRLKALGIKLSIDDFGTGYSSLAYLRNFNVDKLKIDQSFVRDLAKGTDSGPIVKAIIQLAHSLNLKTIAEGVEDAVVLEKLRQQGCDEIQGYYYARPMPAADMTRYLEAGAGSADVSF